MRVGWMAVALALAALGPAPSVQAQDAHACDIGAAPSACIFVLDPVVAAAAQGAELTDPTDANLYLTAVPLEGLEDPTLLVGELVDTDPPASPVEPVEEADGTWATGRGGRGFEAAMAYYWLDYAQRLIAELGFTRVHDGPVRIVPYNPEVVDNAFYSPAEETIHMGVASSGISESEDAMTLLHEYGHALLDAQVPGLFTEEGAAYHEAFGDLFGFLVSLELRYVDPPCWGQLWYYFGEPCFRRLDVDAVYPDDLQHEPHADAFPTIGAVYAFFAALLDADGLAVEDCPGTDACDAVRDRVLGTLLTASGYLTPDSGLRDAAEAFVMANEAVAAGADAELLTAIFTDRGFLTPTGDPTAAGEVQVAIDIAHAYRGDLHVSVGVADADFADLCEPVVLVEPDNTDAGDDLMGEFDLSGTDCAALLPPSPDQQWYLRVEDTLAEDEGEIRGFTVSDGEVPYLAPGLPLPIADADPMATYAVVDGTGDAAGGPGSEPMGTTPGQGPTVEVAIRHPYAGDLHVGAGVVDGDGAIVCSVTLHEPDLADDSDDLAGTAGLGDCADHEPLASGERWFLEVIDTAPRDVGHVAEFAVTGSDGGTLTYTGDPVAIPDDDVDGVVLLLDDAGGTTGTAGGSGAAPAAEVPVVEVALTHPYAGDLLVTVRAEAPNGTALCEVVVASPDPRLAEPGLVAEAELDDCAFAYPPSALRQWSVYAADTLARDEGTLDAVTLTGPDGARYVAAGLPQPLPDADRTGVVVPLEPG